MEICTVTVRVRDKNVVMHGIYRPPDKNIQAFNDRLSGLLDSVRQTNHVFLAGDLNLDIINPVPAAVDFSLLCQSYSFVQLISVPTHVSPGSATCLDQIWYNNIAETKSGVFKLDVTDHYPAFTTLQLLPSNEDFFVKKFRDHSDASLRLLRSKIEIFVRDCDNLLFRDNVNINEAMKLFLDRVYAIYNQCCPVRCKRIAYRRSMKPWISESLIDCVRRKHSLFRDYKRGLVTHNYYSSFKDMVSKLLKRAKVKYFTSRFEAAGNNSAATWKIVNSLVKKSAKSGPARLLLEGNLISEPVDIANSFNDYFSAIAEELDNNIAHTNNTPISYMPPRVNSTFFVTPVIAADVYDVIGKLKCNSNNMSSIPTYILKFAADLLSPIVAELFNMSISNG